MPDPASIARPWLASYPPGVPPTYRYPDVPLTRFLDDAARDFPGAVATSFLGAELSYEELRDATDRFAGALQDLGVAAGDRVAVVLPNTPAMVIATFATLRLGGVVVPLNPLEVDTELRRELADSGARVAVVATVLVPRFRVLLDEVDTLEHVVASGIEDWLPWRKRIVYPLVARRRGGGYRRLTARDGAASFTELLHAAAPVGRQAPVTRDDPAVLQYTGGTTGVPKAVGLTHGNLVANSFQARLWVPDIQAGRERLLAVLPFFHVYGLTLGMLTGVLSAATLILLPRYDVDEVLDAIDRSRPTLFPGVPSMYRDIALHPEAADHDLRSIRACVSGAAPLTPDIARRFEEITGGARLREGYGLSESGPLTHANPIYGRSEHGRIGLPVTDTVAIVVDPDDPTEVLPLGTPGELAVYGPQVMPGYWHAEDETALVLRDGWLLTGDIAVQHEDGTFSIVDRKKDVVIAGGFNIYPHDVETALLLHPGVAQAVAVGIPDDRRGETVKAYVVLKPTATRVTAGELTEHCRQHLAAYKVPTAIELRDELPRTRIGKVLRRELRDEEAARGLAGDDARGDDGDASPEEVAG
ncbi:MAG: long-chain fatty acid--CoA ligase [Actinobacteria bacterium]|nr:long-chain fatty acid--CoA ligase [Actinomycetota bacterium]